MGQAWRTLPVRGQDAFQAFGARAPRPRLKQWGNRKKPYRYRWPNDIRDEVLARLLELNAQRAAEEDADTEGAE